jgi:hypothetical protein
MQTLDIGSILKIRSNLFPILSLFELKKNRKIKKILEKKKQLVFFINNLFILLHDVRLIILIFHPNRKIKINVD